MENVVAVILAAGQGVRMKSKLPKVLHKVCGLEVVSHVIGVVRSAGVRKIVIVIGRDADKVRQKVGTEDIDFVVQEERLGTGHAVMQAASLLEGHFGNVMILCGDAPLMKAETVRAAKEKHVAEGLSCTILSAILKDPTGYGRIIRHQNGKVHKIIEEKDAAAYDKAVEEVNSGAYCFNAKDLLDALKSLKRENIQKEYYLTDVVEILTSKKMQVDSYVVPDSDEIIGINTRRDLAAAEKIFQRRILNFHMDSGVTIIDPGSTYISSNVAIGRDAVIEPYTVIESDVVIGEDCVVGPFAHIRGGTVLEPSSEIGNFVEVKKSRVGAFSKAKHLSYVGDAIIGKKVNIGAGTITANYDGKNKHQTVIEDGASIGSNTTLVAPVKIGKGAVTGAGSVVTRNSDVPPGSVVVGVPAKLLKTKKGEKS